MMVFLVFQNVDKTTEFSLSHHIFHKRWVQPLVVNLRIFTKLCSWWDCFYKWQDTFSF